ncbi:MAG TPA: hypothetical protein VK437_02435, partial [Steroidobacteraceae bacterium]|nr:hypothetical protein [Steroidobacteraceae bacterium]
MRLLYDTLVLLAYNAAVALAAPAAFAVALARGLTERAYWAHLGERFGWGARVDSPSLWLHAV